MTIKYVTETGSGSGTSWANASSLDAALNTAQPGDQIWVAAGGYPPKTGWDVETGAQSDLSYLTFRIPSGVQVYGGFKGGEEFLRQRDFITNMTILNGRSLPGVLVSHAVFFFQAVAGTRLDGFIIKSGNANSGETLGKTGGGILINGGLDGTCEPTIANCILQDNKAESAGGAVMNTAGSNGSCCPVFKNCVFFRNLAGFAGSSSGLGGAVANAPVSGAATNVVISPSFVNCVFCRNTVIVDAITPAPPSAGQGGGAVGSAALSSSISITPSFMNCTFFENNALLNSAGLPAPAPAPEAHLMFSRGDVQTSLTNSIFWQNKILSASVLIKNDAVTTPPLTPRTTIKFSDFNLTRDNNTIVEPDPNNNINANPEFKNPSSTILFNNPWFTKESGLALQAGSPCIEKGTPSGAPSTDITGEPRPLKPSMGAYDRLNPNSIIVQEPGPTEVKLDLGGKQLETLTILAKGADGADFFDTTTNPATKVASGGKGATLEVTYDRANGVNDVDTLTKIQNNGGRLIVNVGASLQAVTLPKLPEQIVCTAIGGGPTTVFIPIKNVQSINFETATLKESAEFLKNIDNVEGPLLLCGGGGGAARINTPQDGGPGRGIEEGNPMTAGKGRSPFGPGGGAALGGAGVLDVRIALTASEPIVTVKDASANGGVGTKQDPQGMLTLETSFGTSIHPASPNSGYYIGGVAGMEVILANGSRVPAGTFGGGGGAGWSGGNGASETLRAGKVPSQGGTSYLNSAFGGTEVNASSTQSSEIVASQTEHNITSADLQTKAEEIVIQQNESLELLTFINAIIKLLNTGSIATIRDLFFNSNALGVTNERDRQGYVIISYTTEPIPPVPPVPPVRPAEVQEKEIVSTNLVYDWNITTSSHNVKLDFEEED